MMLGKLGVTADAVLSLSSTIYYTDDIGSVGEWRNSLSRKASGYFFPLGIAGKFSNTMLESVQLFTNEPNTIQFPGIRCKMQAL